MRPSIPRAGRHTWVKRASGVAALVLGIGSAAVSANWALGGDALLDTVGGEIERWGRRRTTSVLVALWAVVVVKIVVGSAALLATRVHHRVPGWMSGRIPRFLSWVSAIVLTAYGGLLTVVGLLVQAGVLDSGSDVDEKALRWHAFLWDPWFLLWGAMLSISLWTSRRSPSPISVRKRRGRRRSCVSAR
jgi:hypothetical protein